MTSTFGKFALPFVMVSAFVLLGQVASTVRAMCVYNHTNTEIYTKFSCGLFCHNEWTTEPNNHYCRENESGQFTTGIVDKPGREYTFVSLAVEAHGWVSMTRPDGSGEVQVCAYRQDRSQSACQSFDPSSL